jgi:hypothetical protein
MEMMIPGKTVRGIPMMTRLDPLTSGRIFKTWWPLAASWILMALEGPALNIVVARLADPKIHLAAYGSLVFPLALLIEAPIIMLLAASTALCGDWIAYRKVRRFMHVTGAVLTALHALVAFTPLYGLIVRSAIGAPEEIIGPGRIGFMVMLPWTWAIAYRRFNQGVLIRFGHSLTVGIGTGVRLLFDVAVLAAGFALGSLPGTTVATAAIIAGVIGEATYIGWRVRPVLRTELPETQASKPPLSYRAFFRFYVPLSLTSLILLGARPLLTAAISRMPNALDSLAVLPVVISLTFLLRSTGVAYSEVVIAHLGAKGSARSLRRFALGLITAVTAGLLLIAATPLSRLWFGTVTGLSENLVKLARSGLWFALLLPGVSVMQSWMRGIVLHSRRTRSVTEATLIYFALLVGILWIGIEWGRYSGVHVGLAAMTVGELAGAGWLVWRSRRTRRALQVRDAG